MHVCSSCMLEGGAGGGGRSGHWVRAQWCGCALLRRVVVLLLVCGGVCVCPVLWSPALRRGCPTTKLMRQSVAWVACSFLRPTTEPQRGTRGVSSEALLN